MSLAYILDGGMNDRPGTGAEMYERHPAMRGVYADIERWTGLTPEQVLHEERPAGQPYRHGVGTIRQAAAVFGVADVLAEHGVRPSLVCGLSLGALTGACLAGAIDRREFFGLLSRMREAPPLSPDEPPQGVAALTIPADDDPYRHLAEGVHLAADCGRVGGGQFRLLLVGGYRTALDAFAAALPEGALKPVEGHAEAFHTPLQQYLSDYIEPFVAAAEFHDAHTPVCSCMERATVTAADDFRAMFVRNPVTPVSMPYLRTGLIEHGTTLGLLLGPSQAGVHQRSPIPVIHVETPEHLVQALTSVHEFGLAAAAPLGAAR